MSWQPGLEPPHVCHREAYSRFVDSLDYLDTTRGLWDAAVAVSQHALDDLNVRNVRHQLHMLADRVHSRVKTDSFTARWSRLHEVLFDEEGFCGEVEHYYNPLNSYLPAVLQTRRGLPITLCLIYKAVAHRIGLDVTGVNAPGHFLVRLDDGNKGVLVNMPFARGVLTGKFRPGQDYAGNRAALDKNTIEKNIEKAEILRSLSDEYEGGMARLALRFCLSRREVSAVIPGASNPEQLRANLAASNGIGLDGQLLEQVREACRLMDEIE